MYSAKNYSNQKGQALLIILLVMAVILTIALSVISRSVTDISVSQKEEEGARAYSAAEAGIERALLSGSVQLGGDLPSGDQFTTEITGLAANGREYVVPILMSSGETTSIWLVAHNDDKEIECSVDFPCFTGTQVKLCWGEQGTLSDTATTPAIEMSILYKSTSSNSTAKVARAAFDPHPTRNNSFTKGSEGSCIIEGKTFAFSKTVTLSDLSVTARPDVSDEAGGQSARLRLLYNTNQAHSVGMMITSAEGSFPEQGSKIASQGTSGGSTRKIEVYQLYPDLPPIFDYGIFSGTGGITKN